MRARIFLALLLFLGLGASRCQAQASPYSNSVFPSQIFTSTGQTGTVIQLNGLIVPSTIGSSFASGTITLTGTSLSTVTFSLMGSADNGINYFTLPISAVATPGTTTTTVTATANGLYQVNLAGLTHVRFVTSGTFTATSVSLILTATPNGQVARSNGGGGPGAVASVFGRTGAVVPVPNDYSFSQIGGSLSAAQVAAAGGLSNNTSGTAANASNAAAIDGVTVTGMPLASYVPVANNGTSAPWRRLTQDDILPGFSITGFNGGSTVEIGATVTNPVFSASYSSTPTSANITNTDGIGSPLTLTTPFTSGTVTGSFTKTSATSTTFTLNATQAVTKTATTAINWQPRTFGGVGAAAATSSVTASGTNAILSNGATLASAGLSNAATYGPFSPSAQKVYVLMIGGSHTFKDPTTGFAFVFNTPTSVSFVNANGATVTMFLYESTNTLSGTYSVQVVS
jgi:hypothetical protein